MSSLQKHQSTLKRLKKINDEKHPVKYISVVYMDNFTGKIDWPENPNPTGVLVAPKRMSFLEWSSAGNRN